LSEDEQRKEAEDAVEAHRSKVAANEEADDQRKEDEDEVEAHMRKTAPKKV